MSLILRHPLFVLSQLPCPKLPLTWSLILLKKTKYWSLNYWLLYYLPSFNFSNSLIVLQFTLYTYRITACKSFPFFVPKLHLQFPRKKLEALNFPFKKKSPWLVTPFCAQTKTKWLRSSKVNVYANVKAPKTF